MMLDLQSNALLQHLLDELASEKGMDGDTPFYVRLGREFDGLYKNFVKLYGEREDCFAYLKELISALLDLYHERDEVLKMRDRERELSPEWFLSGALAGTMLYLDRYAGGLAALPEKFDYLAELGINTVHIMPILKTPQDENDGGYAVSDYRAVDERFGSMAELKKTAGLLHERGMNLMLDLVLNHTSDEHEWAVRAKKGEAKYQNYYYMYPDRTFPDLYEQTMPEVFPENAPGNFTYVDSINQWVMTVFHHYQWDLNYTNPKVFIEMTKVLLFLANQGVDILRLDAVAFLWKKIGTISQNEPEAHCILQTMRGCAKIVAPGAVFLAEAIVEPKEIVKYFGAQGKSECEMAYNATFMVLLWDAVATKNTKLLMQGLRSIPQKPPFTTWLNYVRCHDDIGLGFSDSDAAAAGYTPRLHRKFLVEYYTGVFKGSSAIGAPFMFDPKTGEARISGALASLAGLEKALDENNRDQTELAVNRIILLHSIIASYGGIPFIYYGDELGTTNDYAYQDDPACARDNRWMHRPVMNWTKAEKRKVPGTVEQRIFTALKKLLELRKNTGVFADTEPARLIPTANPRLFVYLRRNGSDQLLIICNFSVETEYVDSVLLAEAGFVNADLVNIYTDSAPLMVHEKIIMPALSFYWLKKK